MLRLLFYSTGYNPLLLFIFDYHIMPYLASQSPFNWLPRLFEISHHFLSTWHLSGSVLLGCYFSQYILMDGIRQYMYVFTHIFTSIFLYLLLTIMSLYWHLQLSSQILLDSFQFSLFHILFSTCEKTGSRYSLYIYIFF